MNDFKKFSERKLSYHIASLILELNYEYTEKLYRLQNDYPLAPENLEIKKSMLSDYGKKNYK